MKSLVTVFLFMVLCVSVTQVGFCQSKPSQSKPIVFVSILPQKHFVQQLCGDAVSVEVMVMPGENPATYEPKPSQMRKLSKATIYFAIGGPFENSWMKRISGLNPQMSVVHTDHGIEKFAMVDHHHNKDEEVHFEGDGHDDHGEGLDPHIWLGPSLVKKQLQITADALVQLLPAKQGEIEQNKKNVFAKIDLLDGELKSVLQDKKDIAFMVFHPSWGYFAREYNLLQIAVEIEGKTPKAAQLVGIIKKARADNIKVIFVQPQFSRKSAKVIAREIGGEVVVLDPLAEEWFENMMKVAVKIKKAVN